MKTLPNTILLFVGIILSGCNQSQDKKAIPPVEKQSISEPTQTIEEKRKLLSDTIFLGFQFGMSAKDAKAQLSKLKAKGEKISLSDENNKMSGSYTLNTGNYKAKSKIIISFVKDKLSDLQIIILEMDIPGQVAFEPWTSFTKGLAHPPYDKRGRPVMTAHSKTGTGILKDLADYFATFHGEYKTTEGADQFDYYYWDDGNRHIEISESDWKDIAKRSYNADFKDVYLLSFK